MKETKASNPLGKLNNVVGQFFKQDPKRGWIFGIAGFWWIIPLFIASLFTGIPPLLGASQEAISLHQQMPFLGYLLDVALFPTRLLAPFFGFAQAVQDDCITRGIRRCKGFVVILILPFILTVAFWGALALACYEFIKTLTKK